MTGFVVNIKTSKYDVYIGRKSSGMHYGNPFSHRERSMGSVMVDTRKEAIDCYADWLAGTRFQDVEPQRRTWILENIQTLRGKILGCFCRPMSICHGDILARLANI